MRIAVLGRTHWLLDAARCLIVHGHTVPLVATTLAAPEYRVTERDFEDFARRNGAGFCLNPDINGDAFVVRARASGADLAISVNWPKMLRGAICASFPFGILNAHAGALPRFRGNACPNWAILNGERQIGLSVHAMDPDGLDTGSIYARAALDLTDETYIGDVYAWLDRAIPEAFLEAVTRLAEPGFAPLSQSDAGVRPLRSYPRRPDDGLIRWEADAESIARLIRASSRPFAGAFTALEGRERLTVWRGRPVSLDHDVLAVPGQILGRGEGGHPLVACGRGILEMQDYALDSEQQLPTSSRWRLFT